MGTAYGWTVYGTMLALLLAVIEILANDGFRIEGRLESRIGELRAEMREGFAQLDDRLRVLERDRP